MTFEPVTDAELSRIPVALKCFDCKLTGEIGEKCRSCAYVQAYVGEHPEVRDEAKP